MQPTEPLELNHSWPLLLDTHHNFDLGHIFDAETRFADAAAPLPDPHGIGLWECDLRDNALTWSAAVYDIFGFAKGMQIIRAETVSLYQEHSRAAMERLRRYAIRHRRGFTLDVDIRSAQGEARRMRLMAAPVCERGRVVRLRGTKQLIA